VNVTVFPFTVTVAVPVFPLLVAVIVAVPGATPVTTPVAETVAMLAALVLQAMSAPVIVLPLASFVVAVNVVVAPTKMAAGGCDTVTLTTAAVPVGESSSPHATAKIAAAMIVSAIPRFRMM
jgi:hypothetical protein